MGFRLSFHEPAVNVSLPTDGSKSATYKVTVTNAGRSTGDEVVMAYFKPVKVDVPLHPVKSLFDFTRVGDVRPGSSETISFSIHPDNFLLATADGDMVRAPGDYTIVFENGAGEILTTHIKMVGKQVTVEPFPQVPSATVLV